jgi:Kef-type K+ transport system membrane component KefB
MLEIQRLLAGGGSGFGVHIAYEDLYAALVFLAAIYVSGQFASRVCRMPSLVGEIFCGILLGPPLAAYAPNPPGFVLFGEIGLVLLVLEAGVDVDLTMLKLIGSRGLLIAVVGSALPIAIGVGIAFAYGLDVKGAIAAGASFGPTSLGIAMNILRAGKMVNTPVGQLVVSAAVIDDMIALVILSQLEALATEREFSGRGRGEQHTRVGVR